MSTAVVRQWSAWSPGLEDRGAWERWAGAPEPLGLAGCPDAAFLPAMLRRRCGSLARIMLTVAFDCCSAEGASRVRTVFASRHGNINESIDLLVRLAEGQPLSPTRFSHTVHNAQAGLFSIAASNRHASSSIAAQEDTFACGFLEALTHLHRDPSGEVLLVMGDVPLAETFAAMVDEPVASYGLALRLAARGDGTRVSFACGGDGALREPPWPQGAEFLRWLLSDERALTVGSGPRRWHWSRDS